MRQVAGEPEQLELEGEHKRIEGRALGAFRQLVEEVEEARDRGEGALAGLLLAEAAEHRLQPDQTHREAGEDLPNVSVIAFSGLTVDAARAHGATVLVRGLRAVTDFHVEFDMALMNRKLNPGLETVFMMPAEAYSYVSSRLVKEIFRNGGSVKGLVPPLVENYLRRKIFQGAAPQRA